MVKFKRKYEFRQEGDVKKMAKSTGKKTAKKRQKRTMPAKKTGETIKGQTKAAEYVANLVKLHKLQGVLLSKLKREI